MAQHFLGRVSKNSLGGWIPTRDNTSQRFAPDGILRIRYDGREKRAPVLARHTSLLNWTRHCKVSGVWRETLALPDPATRWRPNSVPHSYNGNCAQANDFPGSGTFRVR